MSFLNSLTKVVLVIIALVFTIIVGQIVPENQFTPYQLELDSTWAKEADVQDYLVDLNHDNHYEIIRHNHINKPGHSLELINNKQISILAVAYEKSFNISRFLRFADVNQDGILEMMFISVTDSIARLFIMGFDFKPNNNTPVLNYHLVEIDSVGYWNNVPDALNYDILVNGPDIYFDLQAGYYIQPRNVYKYNFKTEKLIKTQRSSIVNKQLELLECYNQDYLLAKNVVGTGNTLNHEQLEKFRVSKNADSLKTYDLNIALTYDYGDFSSYILLYNENLDFAFKPVEFCGWTNFTLSDFLWIDGLPCIISLTNNKINDSSMRKITLCNLHGEILKQVRATENFENLFADTNEFALYSNQNLHIYSSALKLEKMIFGLSYVSGYYDLTPNFPKEFIGFEKNELVVFSEGFKKKTSFKIAQEFAPYPEKNNIQILKKSGKTCLLFNSRLFYYLFSYEKNALAWLKYPFYATLFLFWFGMMFFLLKLNSRRLEHEKQHLEKIVSERTAELQSKNLELAAQKEEIQTQAEEISGQYERLEKLDHFKETLTHALVHDLKNPLSQIMLKTSNPLINLAARKMHRLITNMLDVEKYENAGFRLNKETHSLRGMLEEVKTGQQPALGEKNLKLSLHFDDYLVQADKEVMIRVFDNLLSNAIRFSPLNRSIDVFAEPSGDNMLQITMKNYGVPIPAEALPLIFDKYRHFGKTEGGVHHSTGLGLTFCKMALEAHNGKIGASNNPDEGCSFWFAINYTTQIVDAEKTENIVSNFKPILLLTQTDVEVLKQVVKQIKEFKIFEISRFHEALDPLKGTAGSNVNEWISRLFSAINIQNIEEYNRLINLIENEQAKNSDR